MNIRTDMIAVGTVCSILLTGCSTGGSKTETTAEKLNGSFTAGVTMELEGLTAKGTLTRQEAGTWSMYFEEPSQLAGVQLDFAGDTVAASYKGLEFSVPQAAMPSKSLLTQCITVMDTIAEEGSVSGETSETGTVLTGTLESGPYTLCIQEDGTPAYFQMENVTGCITFETFETGGTSMSEETTSPEMTTETTASELTETAQTSEDTVS